MPYREAPAGALVIATFNGIVRAHDASTGEVVWKQTFDLDLGSFSATAMPDRVYVVVGKILATLERASGRILWKAKVVDDAAQAVLHVQEVGDAVVVAFGGSLVALGRADGSVRWRDVGRALPDKV